MSTLDPFLGVRQAQTRYLNSTKDEDLTVTGEGTSEKHIHDRIHSKTCLLAEGIAYLMLIPFGTPDVAPAFDLSSRCGSGITLRRNEQVWGFRECAWFDDILA